MNDRHISILGMGLIGGSLARAVREKWPQAQLSLMDSGADTLALAGAALPGAKLTQDAAEAVRGAELIIICVPIQSLGVVARAMSPGISPGAVVTDAASVKRAAMEAIAPHLPQGLYFVPGHPIAGKESSGFSASDAALFTGKRVALTPESPPEAGSAEEMAAQYVAEFWRGLGAEPFFLPPDMHDRIYAAVSHLPQYLSFKINILFEDCNVTREEVAPDGPLARFLRLSRSSPDLWRGIFDANKINLNNALKKYREAMHQMQAELSEERAQTERIGGLSQACATFFPYLAASCLVSAIAREERELGVSFREFAGTGFADFTAPLAAAAPEAVMEAVSNHAAEVAQCLAKFIGLLDSPGLD